MSRSDKQSEKSGFVPDSPEPQHVTQDWAESMELGSSSSDDGESSKHDKRLGSESPGPASPRSLPRQASANTSPQTSPDSGASSFGSLDGNPPDDISLAGRRGIITEQEEQQATSSHDVPTDLLGLGTFSASNSSESSSGSSSAASDQGNNTAIDSEQDAVKSATGSKRARPRQK